MFGFIQYYRTFWFSGGGTHGSQQATDLGDVYRSDVFCRNLRRCRCANQKAVRFGRTGFRGHREGCNCRRNNSDWKRLPKHPLTSHPKLADLWHLPPAGLSTDVDDNYPESTNKSVVWTAHHVRSDEPQPRIRRRHDCCSAAQVGAFTSALRMIT